MSGRDPSDPRFGGKESANTGGEAAEGQGAQHRPADDGTGVRRFVITAGIAAALIVVAHLLRLAADGPALLQDPTWVSLTVAAAAMSVWAWRLS